MYFKKNKFMFLILCGLFLIFLVVGCSFNNRLKYIGESIKINIDNCKIEHEKDTHGGFLGDGEYFAKIICTDEKDEEIKIRWKIYPLSDELQKAMKIKTCEDNGCKDVYERYSIPNIKNGYYYFFDRHSDSVDNKSELELNKRSSYNFSVGIYDIDNNILYYYELDT